MNDHNKEQQLRYLEEVCIPLHRAGFETQPLDESQLPVHWNGAPLCRITGKGSVFYRREDVDTPLAEDALLRVEDIAARTMEYMTAMENALQLEASGLEGDYRILADFNGTVLAGSHSKYGVQFVTWDWDYERTGVTHGHYFMENYDGAKQDFVTRSGLIHKEQLFSPEQMTEMLLTLRDTCGHCDECDEDECACRDLPIEELIRPAVTVPDWAREEADIPSDAKLGCYVDEDSGEITICETDYEYDLSDIPPAILFALRKGGCCLSVLEDVLMENDIVYDK